MTLLDMQGITRSDSCGSPCGFGGGGFGGGGFSGGFGGGFAGQQSFGGGIGIPINLSLCSFTFCPELF